MKVGIDSKEAVKVAREYINKIYIEGETMTIEEVELTEDYKNWVITMSIGGVSFRMKDLIIKKLYVDTEKGVVDKVERRWL